MPGIFKRFVNVSAAKYVFPDADDLSVVSEEQEPQEQPQPEEESPPEEPEAPEPEPEPTAVDFAQIQANAILETARMEAEELKRKAMKDVQDELEELRAQANKEGYDAGYAQGIAEGRMEANRELNEKARVQEKDVQDFLKGAVRARDQLLEDSKQDLKELALTIAEKVIRVSLKSSGDILLRMIESATAKRRRCEWVQIYIADCDAKNIALSTPELNAALGHLSDRVRIIPMADDESGTCIIEMPDEIIDASVSTQMDNIREMMSTAVRE